MLACPATGGLDDLRGDNGQQERKHGRKFLVVLALALVVGYVFSWAGVLGTEYKYGATLDRQQVSPINPYGVDNGRWHELHGTNAYAKGDYNLNYNPATNFGFGLGWWRCAISATALCVVAGASDRVPDAGYISGPRLWFSFFVGWLVKQLIVKFGGHKLYMNARPFFLGIIVGESVAAGVWLLVSIVLSLMGTLYVQVSVMPW